MNRKEMQNKVIEFLPSRTLKKAIADCGFNLSSLNLVKAVINYVPLLKDRLALLEMFTAAEGKRASELAKKAHAHLTAMRDEFLRDDPEAVFELHVSTREDAWVERYICRSYDAALRMIEGFWLEYADISSNGERESTIYKIVKRRILSDVFSEDELGMCILNGNLEVECVDTWDMRAEAGYDCCYNNDIPFPNFVPDLAPVRYEIPGRFPSYGICIDLTGDAKVGEFYVLNLNSGLMFDKNWDYITESHEHIAPAYVELVSEDELPEKLRQNYRDFIKAQKDGFLPWKL